MDRNDGKCVEDWLGYVGHRCIIIEDRYAASPFEVFVQEVSPKGRVKVRFPYGNIRWADKSEYLLIEDLGLLEGARVKANQARKP